MITNIDQAIYKRWNDCGLNTGIAVLWPGSDTNFGPPELGASVVMPRAQYYTNPDMELSVSKGTREHMQACDFSVWGTKFEVVSGYLDLIYNAFVNADQAGTNPMAMQSNYGEILGVDYGGGQNVSKLDDAVFVGQLTVNIRWGKPNRIPV